MDKTDFTKTSEQVEKEAFGIIESVEKSLESSTNESERKGQLVFGATLSIIVFLGILGFDILSTHEKKDAAKDSPQKEMQNIATTKEMSLIGENLSRIDENTKAVAAIQEKIAPSMPISGNLQSIRNSTEDIRRVLSIKSTLSPTPPSDPPN